MLLSKSEVCDSKKLKFIKEQEASGLLTRLSKIALFGPLSSIVLNNLTQDIKSMK